MKLIKRKLSFGSSENNIRRFKTHLLKHAVKLMLLISAFFAVTAGVVSGQTTIEFASGVSAPQAGIVLTGAGINPTTGQFFRHLWSADGATGLCRLDADIDTQGLHSVNPATCITSVAGLAFTAAQIAFDPATNDIYVTDSAANGLGVIRLHYHPDGDSGHGLIDQVQEEVLGGLIAAGKRGTNCNIGLNSPDSMTFGPDGNLYIGFKKSPNIMRLLSPGTEPYPCSDIQLDVANSPDARMSLGLSWAGHDLYALDSRGIILFAHGDLCLTPQLGNISCNARPTSIITAPPTTMTSDQVYPSLSGKNLYFANTTTITHFNISTFLTTSEFGGQNFSFVSALVVDTNNPASPVLFVGDDPSNGLTPGLGRWFEITSAPLPPAPPAIPTGVVASAGNADATISWINGQNGQPVTSYTVHNSFASNQLTVPDTIVGFVPGTTFVPTSVIVGGLTNGVSYQFEVLASNQFGSSAFSAASNTVTPSAPTVPGPPINVDASVESGLADGFALVAWSTPTFDGGSFITSYTVTTLLGGVPVGVPVTVSSNFSGAAISGLTDGDTYTFTVHATNAIGSGPESAPSNAVTPVAPPPPPPTPPDLSVTMTGPTSVNFETNATYVITVVNNGPTSAPQVNLTDTFSNIGAIFAGSTSSQGGCLSTNGTVSCNLGTMAAGATVTLNITLNLSAQGANQVSVQATDAGGNVLNDPNPANNSASVSTGINGVKDTTDIQVVGSAQNGGPAAGQSDTYTWQIKNGQNQIANDVVFSTTLPSTLVFTSVSSNIGTCTALAAGSAGGTITCSVGTIPVGQTMLVTINVVVPKAGTIALKGSATFNGTDTNLPNNSFTVTIQAR